MNHNLKQAHTDHPINHLLTERWSPYAFDSRPVNKSDLASLFEAARWAPSSYNEQPWSYIVATREQAAEFERLLSCLVEGKLGEGSAGAGVRCGAIDLCAQ